MVDRAGRSPRRLPLFVALLLGGIGLGALLGGSGPSTAGPVCTKSWAAAVGGTWDDGTKWSPAGAPTAADDVCITVAGSYTVTMTGARSANSLQVGASSGAGAAQFSLLGVGCTADGSLTV